MKPAHKHDCDNCKFVGKIITNNGIADLYKPCANSLDKYLIRFSSEPSDYRTTSLLDLWFK